eukprot:33701_1
MAAVVEQKQKEAIARPIKVFGQDQERWMKFIPDESILIASAHGDWACIGIDHPIDPLRTTSFEIMPIAVSPSNLHKQHFAVGLASKGVINSVGYDYMGKYVESWCYYCNGNIMTDTKCTGTMVPIALHQAFRMELKQFTMNMYIQGVKVGSCDLKELFHKHKKTTFYFGVSMVGKGSKIKIIEFKHD